MNSSQPQPQPPLVMKVVSQPPGGPLEKILIDLIGRFINKFPPRWKTLTGLILLAASWLFRAFLAPQLPQYPWMETASEWLEYAALALTGIGVFHKALLADPSRVK
jgi:hypothetical protein